MNRAGGIRLAAVVMMVFLITAGVFWQSTGFEFLDFDDDVYVTQNLAVRRGWEASTLCLAVTERIAGNWQPLTFLSHASDVEFFGLNPAGHHATSIILHAINACLVVVLGIRLGLGVWVAGFCALLFSLHPLRVESVAWVAERKDVLCATFFLTGLLAYLRYAARPSHWWYALTCGLFVLGLMAKPMVITFPVVLLLLDVWPLQRINLGPGWFKTASRAVVEKLPLFGISAVLALVTIMTQSEAGAVRNTDQVPVDTRIQTAVVASAAYIEKSVWPTRLSPLYTHPQKWGIGTVACSLGFFAGISLAAVVLFLRGRYWWLVGWLWFLMMILPVVGIIQVGDQWMADRYTYLPMLFLVLALGFECTGFVQGQRWRAVTASLAASAVVVVLVWLTLHQLPYWKDGGAISARAIAMGGDHWTMRTNQAIAHSRSGDLQAALKEFEAIYRDFPYNPEGVNNLAFCLLSMGRPGDAIPYFQEAVKIKPQYHRARVNLGDALLAQGNTREALECYEHVIAADPGDPGAYIKAARIRWEVPGLRDVHAARSLSSMALQRSPQPSITALELLGLASADLGDIEEAADAFNRASVEAGKMGRPDLVKVFREQAEALTEKR